MLEYRQGDVALVRIDAIDAEFEKACKVTLAEGEKTGHAHVLFADPADAPPGESGPNAYPLSVAEKDGVMYLRVAAPLPLRHQEHATITVEPGTYRVQRQREYAPEAPRWVAD